MAPNKFTFVLNSVSVVTSCAHTFFSVSDEMCCIYLCMVLIKWIWECTVACDFNAWLNPQVVHIKICKKNRQFYVCHIACICFITEERGWYSGVMFLLHLVIAVEIFVWMVNLRPKSMYCMLLKVDMVFVFLSCFFFT